MIPVLVLSGGKKCVHSMIHVGYGRSLEAGEDFLGSRLCLACISHVSENIICEEHTVHTSVIRLDMSTLDFTILNHKSITLGAVLTKDGGAIEREVELFGEFTRWVSQEADACLPSGIESLSPCCHPIQ